MISPLQFPDPMEESRRRADEFQRLPPDERWHEIAALMEFGWDMVRSSPNRDATEHRMMEQEMRWREIQQDLFARHAE